MMRYVCTLFGSLKFSVFRSYRSLVWSFNGMMLLLLGLAVWQNLQLGWMVRPLVFVSGCRRTRPEDIRNVMYSNTSTSWTRTPLLSHCANRILCMPWVSRVTLVRLWPSYVLVQIQEKAPVAIWQHQGVQKIVAHDGSIVDNIPASSFSSLPVISGDDCVKHFSALQSALQATIPMLHLKGATYLRSGSWVLYHGTKGGRLWLPSHEITDALHTLRHYWPIVQHADVIDIRSPHTMIFTGVD